MDAQAPAPPVEMPIEPAARRPRIFLNTLATVGGRACSQLFRLVAMLLAVAHLGPEAWGTYGLLLSSLDVFRALTNFGLDTVTIRWLAMHPESARSIQRRVMLLKVSLALAGFAGLVGSSALMPERGAHLGLLAILGLSLFPQGVAMTLVARFQAEHQMHRLIPVQAIVGGIYLACVFGATRVGLGVRGFVLLAAAYDLLNCAAIAIHARRTIDPSTGGAPFHLSWGAFLLQAVPLGIIEFTATVYLRVGVFLLEQKGDLAAVGHLYAAMKVNEQTMVVAGALAMSALPVFARNVHEGQARDILRPLLRSSLMGAALTVSLALGATFLGEPVLLRLKPAYAQAVGPLAALAWATVFMFQNGLFAAVLYAFGRFRQVALTGLLSLTVLFSFGLWLVPAHGALGAGIATLCTEVVNAAVYVVALVLLYRREGRARAEPVRAAA